MGVQKRGKPKWGLKLWGFLKHQGSPGPAPRREVVESYIKRLKEMEEIALSYPGVQKTYAIQAGREVRIMVKPDAINDDALILLAHSISQKIEETLDYPGQIKVNVIRESRAVDYAK